MRLVGLLVIALLSTITAGQRFKGEKEEEEGKANYCKTLGYLRLKVVTGSCSGFISSSCKGVVKAQNSIVEGFDEWYGEAGSGLCATGRAEATAIAHAQALAEVWASGVVNVYCDGQGFACGWVLANVETWSVAFAKATALAAAEASTRQANAPALCYADIEALSTVFAKAATKAKGDTCSYGGDSDPVKFMQETFASAIQIGVAEAYARAAARSCDNEKLKASSKCSGEASTLGGVGREIVHGGNVSQTQVGSIEGCGGSTPGIRCADGTPKPTESPPQAPESRSADTDGCGGSGITGRSAGGCEKEEPAEVPETPATSGSQKPSEPESDDVNDCEGSTATARSAGGCSGDTTEQKEPEPSPTKPSESESDSADNCGVSASGANVRSSNCPEESPEASSPSPSPRPPPTPTPTSTSTSTLTPSTPSPSSLKSSLPIFIQESTPATPELRKEAASAAVDEGECTGEVKRKCCFGRITNICVTCRGCRVLRNEKIATVNNKLTWKFVDGSRCFCP